MKITEKDIFNFVYYPWKLSNEKHYYIKENMNLFEVQIKLCEDTLESIKQIDKNENQIIILSKKPTLNFKKEQHYHLAADSISLDKSIRTETFIDVNNDIIAKVVFYHDKTKIFILNEDNTLINNFKLIIKPADKTYHLASSKESLELPAGLEIDSIKIEL